MPLPDAIRCRVPTERTTNLYPTFRRNYPNLVDHVYPGPSGQYDVAHQGVLRKFPGALSTAELTVELRHGFSRWRRPCWRFVGSSSTTRTLCPSLSALNRVITLLLDKCTQGAMRVDAAKATFIAPHVCCNGPLRFPLAEGSRIGSSPYYTNR